MGSGKSSAAITYMNENPDKKYIYITPYLDETERIQCSCPDLDFYLPPKVDTNEEAYSKTAATLAAIKKGRNIASTHQCFRFYTREIVEVIKAQGYTLLVDESVDSLERVDNEIAGEGDLDSLVRWGVLGVEEDKSLVLTEKADEYGGTVFKQLFRIMESRRLVYQGTEEEDNTGYYFWVLSAELIQAFDEVIVMTYMFDACDMKYMFDINGIEYQNIYIRKESGDAYNPSQYHFSDTPSYVPEYVRRLPELIDIYEHKATDKGADLNKIGDNPRDLSSTWQKVRATKEQMEELRTNIGNWFRNVHYGPAGTRLWSCYKHSISKLQGRGYTSRHLAYNTRGVNDQKGTYILAYIVNIYAHPAALRYYKHNGVKFDQNRYALSTMIQWIWRSAIRDGKPIHIYIPSKRMRDLLTEWIEETSRMGVSET